MKETPMQENEPITPTIDPQNAEAVMAAIVQLLEDKKAENCQVVDLRRKAAFCDFFVIASGNVGRQLNALADHVARFLKDLGLPYGVEGAGGDEWILVDGGDVVVHLFRPEARDRYALDKMWSESISS